MAFWNKTAKAKAPTTVFIGMNDTTKQAFEGGANKTVGEIDKPQQLTGLDTAGEPHPFDYAITNGLYQKMSFVSGVVDKIVDYVWGPGFFIKSDDKKAKDIIDQWNEDVNFKLVGRKWFRQGLVKGFSPLELGGDKKSGVQGIKLLNADRVFIKRDTKGNIKEINQIKGSMTTISAVTKGNLIQFSPENIAIFNVNQVDDEAYGRGIVHPNLVSINNLIDAETNMHQLMKRKANEPIVATLGNTEAGDIPTQDAIDDVANRLTYMTNKTEWAVSDSMKMSVLSFGDVGKKFNDILTHDADMLFFGFQTPEVVMGRGNIPEGLATAQTEGFDRYIQSRQVELEAVIETIYERVLLAQGIKSKVEFIWGEPSKSDINASVTQITTLLSNPMLSPQLNFELQKKLADIFDIPESAVIPPDQAKKAADNGPAPPVPGAKPGDTTPPPADKKKQKPQDEFYEGEIQW